jgi:hypothetical protein
MATKTVICYAMHEYELAAASQALTNAQPTDSFVLGEIDEAAIPALEAQGLIVQAVEPVELAAVETPGQVMTLGLRAGGALEMAGAGVGDQASGWAADISDLPALTPGIEGFYVLTLAGPLLESWRQELDATGIRLLERVPPRSYTAHLDSAQLVSVQGLAFVEGLRSYRREDTGPLVSTLDAPPSEGERGREMLTYDIRLHRPEDLGTVQAWLAQTGVAIARVSTRKLRIYLLESADLADQIAALPEVAALEHFIEPKLYNDVARKLIGVDAVDSGQPQLAEDASLQPSSTSE